MAGEGKLVLIADHGYTARHPDSSARVLDLLEAAYRRGFGAFGFDRSAMTIGRINPAGLGVFAQTTGITLVPPGDPRVTGPRGISLSRQKIPAGGPQPCSRFSDGTGLYVFRGEPGPFDIRRQRNLYCPL